MTWQVVVLVLGLACIGAAFVVGMALSGRVSTMRVSLRGDLSDQEVREYMRGKNLGMDAE